MVKNLSSLLITLLVGLAVGAGSTLILDRLPAGSLGRDLDAARVELGSTRQSLDAARASGDRLASQLATAQGLARDGAGSIDAALASAGRVSDANDRLVLLARAIRGVAASLRSIVAISPGGGQAP